MYEKVENTAESIGTITEAEDVAQTIRGKLNKLMCLRIITIILLAASFILFLIKFVA